MRQHTSEDALLLAPVKVPNAHRSVVAAAGKLWIRWAEAKSGGWGGSCGRKWVEKISCVSFVSWGEIAFWCRRMVLYFKGRRGQGPCFYSLHVLFYFQSKQQNKSLQQRVVFSCCLPLVRPCLGCCAGVQVQQIESVFFFRKLFIWVGIESNSSTTKNLFISSLKLKSRATEKKSKELRIGECRTFELVAISGRFEAREIWVNEKPAFRVFCNLKSVYYVWWRKRGTKVFIF